jgi:hypothetical protein
MCACARSRLPCLKNMSRHPLRKITVEEIRQVSKSRVLTVAISDGVRTCLWGPSTSTFI